MAKALGKPLSRLTVITLAKPRHDKAIKEMQGLGVRVFAIPDGDVAASILTCLPDSEVDMLYGIGGAPDRRQRRVGIAQRHECIELDQHLGVGRGRQGQRGPRQVGSVARLQLVPRLVDELAMVDADRE